MKSLYLFFKATDVDLLIYVFYFTFFYFILEGIYLYFMLGVDSGDIINKK